MLSPFRLSVCSLSVTFVRPTQPFKIFGNFSSFGTLAILWHPRKSLQRSSQGNPSVGCLNAKVVAKYSDFYLWNAVSPKRCKIGGKLVLITNRKSNMSFRLVPKSVTLSDLERRNGPYFALFLPNLFISWENCVKVVDEAITMDSLRLLCLVVNVCRGTARRPRYKFL